MDFLLFRAVPYAIAATLMVPFLVWVSGDRRPQRTARDITLFFSAVLLWPITLLVLAAGLVYVFVDVVVFEARRDEALDRVTGRPTGAACDQRNPVYALWCRRCGAALRGGEHVGTRP